MKRSGKKFCNHSERLQGTLHYANTHENVTLALSKKSDIIVRLFTWRSVLALNSLCIVRKVGARTASPRTRPYIRLPRINNCSENFAQATDLLNYTTSFLCYTMPPVKPPVIACIMLPI
jgi:hypothetical protein